MKFWCLLIGLLVSLGFPGYTQNLVADPDTSNTAVGGEVDGLTNGATFSNTLIDGTPGAEATSRFNGTKWDLGASQPQWRVDLIGGGLVAGQQYTVTINGAYSNVSKNSGDSDSIIVLNNPGAFALTGSTGTVSSPGVFSGIFTAVSNSSTITFEINESRGSSFLWTFASMTVTGPPKVPELDTGSSFWPLVSFILLFLITSGRKTVLRE